MSRFAQDEHSSVSPEEAVRIANELSGNLNKKMGIEFTEFSVEKVVATMPVAGNEQPLGLLHGGAHLVLGETMGSMAANYFAGPGRFAVGIEISASHSKAVTEGVVTGVCTPIHLGGTLTTHEIVITDEKGTRLSTVRITNILRDEKKR